jgi:trehalose/maltose hydrolase-like predicted phosphorylase
MFTLAGRARWALARRAPLLGLALGVLEATAGSARDREARDADVAESFRLTATARDLARYYPTYLANGYLSMTTSLRGTSATLSQAAAVMDYTPEDVSRPAAIPSWNEIDYFDGADWLNTGAVSAATHLGYRQTLDMHAGLLETRYEWRSSSHATRIAVTSFVSGTEPHLGVTSMELRPAFDGRIRLRFTLSVLSRPKRLPLARLSAAEFSALARASEQAGLISGGRRDAIWYPGTVEVADAGGDAGSAMLWIEGKASFGRPVALAVAMGLPRTPKPLHAEVTRSSEGVWLQIEIQVQRGRNYRFSKFAIVSSPPWGGGVEEDLAAARAARETGFGRLRERQVAAWRELWRTDVRVGGSRELQRKIHSDLFYLLENVAPGTSSAVGACGFSPNYFGHVFWDNDFWVFPALLLLHPQRALALIEFRQRTLPQALERAAARGFAGAMYPWEADPWTGAEVTPSFAVANAEREVHVNGAVALAQWQYYLATLDARWLRERAYPVIAAVADFWASRASFNPLRRRYELLHVTSPEEDYTDVDNEIYTNLVAQRSLLAALSAAARLGVDPHPLWREVGEQLYTPTAGEGGVYHDFDPRTPHDKKTSWMASSLPMLSIPALGFTAPPEVLRGLFQQAQSAVGQVREKANQMILVMMAIEAATVGESRSFADLIGGAGGNDPFLRPPFNVRSETPQNDSLYLLSTSGGFLQAFLYGLTGLRIEESGLKAQFPPVLPRELAYLHLVNVHFRGRAYTIRLSRSPTGEVIRAIEGAPENTDRRGGPVTSPSAAMPPATCGRRAPGSSMACA